MGGGGSGVRGQGCPCTVSGVLGGTQLAMGRGFKAHPATSRGFMGLKVPLCERGVGNGCERRHVLIVNPLITLRPCKSDISDWHFCLILLTDTSVWYFCLTLLSDTFVWYLCLIVYFSKGWEFALFLLALSLFHSSLFCSCRSFKKSKRSESFLLLFT